MITAFSIGAAVVTTRAAQQSQHSVGRNDRYEDWQRAVDRQDRQ